MNNSKIGPLAPVVKKDQTCRNRQRKYVMEGPCVSVVVPNYNHERFIRRRMESILDQSYEDFEIILLDDCSNDGSPAILEEYAAHPKVTNYVKNEKNSGSSFAQWEKGVLMCKGKYVWIAESDDFCEKGFLEELVASLEGDSEAALAYCQSVAIDQHDKRLFSMIEYTNYFEGDNLWDNDFTMDGRSFCVEYLMSRNVIPNASGVVFRRDIAMRSGVFNSQMRLFGDLVFWASLLKDNSVKYRALEMNFFRRHSQTVRNEVQDDRKLTERYLALKYIQKLFSLSDEILVRKVIEPHVRLAESYKSSFSYRLGNLFTSPAKKLTDIFGRW